MTNYTTDTSQRKAARIAGLLFLLSLMVPLLNWTLVVSKFIVAENAIDTARNILSNEFLFRIGIINDVVTSIVVLALALTLYIILKSVNRNLALLALFLKLTEAILWAVLTLGNYTGLLILKGQASLTTGEPGQIQALIGLFLNAHVLKTAIAGIFLGLSSTVFLYLLLKSKYVPRRLAGFGIISYALIFIHDSMIVLSPNYANIPMTTQMIFWGPSILFELMIGFWLLIKGINAQPQDDRALESA